MGTGVRLHLFVCFVFYNFIYFYQRSGSIVTDELHPRCEIAGAELFWLVEGIKDEQYRPRPSGGCLSPRLLHVVAPLVRHLHGGSNGGRGGDAVDHRLMFLAF